VPKISVTERLLEDALELATKAKVEFLADPVTKTARGGTVASPWFRVWRDATANAVRLVKLEARNTDRPFSRLQFEVDDLEAELDADDDVAAVFFPAHLDGLAGTTPLVRACELAHAHDVPVLVDAAYLIEPPERTRELVASGADLVSFSAKYFGGPNAGGFVCGRRELVAAVAAVDFIRFEAGEHHRWGRPFKLDRQTIVAVYVALRDWFAAGAEARLADYARKVELLRARLAGRPGLDLTSMCFTMEETLEPKPVNCLHIRVDPLSGTTAADVDRELQAGDPSVLAHVVGDALVVVVDSVSDEDDELLANRLAAAFG
jgi:hypothetical protein